MKQFEEKTLNSQTIFTGKIISLQVDDVKLPDGKKAKREIVKHPGAVAILALTNDKRIILVKQYRKALERSLIEIPAGKQEAGEQPEKTALRELEEETGYVCSTLEHIQSFYTSPGFADEIIHLYFAKHLKKKENPLQVDEDEFVELMEVSLDEALQLIADKKIYDAKTIFAIQYLQLQAALASK